MARVRGGVTVNSSYESTIAKPFDARTLVPTYEDLKDQNNWLSSTGARICYNGMLVAVANTTNTTNNGLYMLFDASSPRKPDVSKDENWIKVGETSDIGDFTTRLTTIETELDSIKDRLDALEAEGSDVVTYGYRSGFPVPGEANKLYVAADEQKTYIWFNDQYMSVGGDSEEPEVIFGGTAD